MDDLEFKELRADVKDIKKEVATISHTLVANTASLVIHEARTTASEKRIETVERITLGLLSSALIGLILKLVLK